jgi:large subunit ribosomal protein L29
MESKKIKELWKMADSELQKELNACQETLLKLRFQKVVEEASDNSIIRKTRRKIARIKTILHQRSSQAKPVEAK